MYALESRLRILCICWKSAVQVKVLAPPCRGLMEQALTRAKIGENVAFPRRLFRHGREVFSGVDPTLILRKAAIKARSVPVTARRSRFYPNCCALDGGAQGGLAAPEHEYRGVAELPELPPILAGKDFAAPSVFEPENLLREARRQKNVP